MKKLLLLLGLTAVLAADTQDKDGASISLTTTIDGSTPSVSADGVAIVQTIVDRQVADFVAASSQLLHVASHTDFDFGTGDFTVAFFARWDDLDAAVPYGTPVSRGPVGTTGWMCRESTTTAGAVQFYIAGTAYVQQTGLSTGQWYHHCITRSGTTVTHYLDAGGAQTGTNSSSLTNASRLEIGCSEANANRYLDGKLDCLGIWKGKALSAAEVTTLYNGGKGYKHGSLPSGLLTSLVAYYDFDDDTGNLVDSESGHDLTNVNAATFPDYAP